MDPSELAKQDYLKSVFEEVIANFNSIELKKLVREQCFMAGGCIRSLHNNEEINDYDFFFRTKEAADKFIKLIDLGLNNDLAVTPLAEAVGNNQGFTKKPMRLKQHASNKHCEIQNKVLAVTHNAVTFRLESKVFESPYHNQKRKKQGVIQFVTKYCGEPDRLIENFDFTNSMAYYTLEGGVVKQYQFIAANKHKRLSFNDRAFSPLNSLARVDKFTKQGYHIKWDDLQELILKITEKHTTEDIKKYRGTGVY